METVKIDGKSMKIKYRTDSGMRTKASFGGKTFTQGLGCDVYNVEDGKHIALVLCNSNLADLLKSVTVISIDEYDEISNLYDPYNGGRYHTALLEKCGAENHLKLL